MTPNLRYAAHDGFTWSTETIEFSQMRFVSMDLDSQNLPHIVYDIGDSDVGYARLNQNDQWVLGSLYEDGQVSAERRAAGIAMDAQDKPHAVHRDESYMGEIYYSVRDGSWSNTFVATETNTDLPRTSVSIAMGTIPHIAFYDAKQSELIHLAKPNAWVELTVDLGEIISPSIAMEGDAPRIAWFNATDDELRLGTYSNAWADEPIGAFADLGSVDLAIGPDGEPHVVFIDIDAGGVPKYASQDGQGQWTVEVIDADASVEVDRIVVGVDGENVAHVGFFDVDYGGVRYAIRAP
jgi:hypothetical protein